MSESLDPYRAPMSATFDVGATGPGSIPPRTAGKWRRLGTFLIDYVGQVVLMMVLLVPVVVIWPEFGAQIETMSKAMELLLGLVIALAYYILFEGLFARTPGKWLCGTRVVDEQGLAPSFKQVLGRTFARLVPFEALSVLLASSDDVRGWHDSWPRTRVILTR